MTARKFFERKPNSTLLLNLLVISILGVVLIVACRPDDTLLRPSLYLFWKFFFESPLSVLIIIGLILLLLFALSVLGGRELVDSVLSSFAFGFTALFLFMLALNTLNVGVRVLYYPFTAHHIPPLNVHNPLFGALALSLILLKGFLLERISFRGSSGIEKVCLVIGLGFGCTSLQTAILSYLRLLYPTTVMGLDLFLFTSLLLIYLTRSTGLRLPKVSSRLNARCFSSLRGMKRSHLVVLSAITVLLLTDSYYSIAAVVEFDSLAYLAYYAKVMYVNHEVLDLHGTSIGLEMSAAYPVGFQALGVYFYEYVGTVDDFYMRILPPIFYLSLLLATYLLSSQIFEDAEDRFLCVFAVSATLILNYYVALSSHYATYLAFLSTMTLYFLFRYLKVQDSKLLFYSSFFGGLASLVNYLGLSTVVFLCIVAAQRKIKPASLLLKALLINALIPSFYLLHNLFSRGDPLYPFLTFSSDPLWALRGQHFYLQSIYAGLQLSSPFSIVDFLAMRSFGARPWVTVSFLTAPMFIAYALRKGELRSAKIEEKTLVLFFGAALSIFLIASTFERYILPMIAVYACFYVWIRRKAKDFGMKRLVFALTLILVYSFSITLGASLGGYKSFNSNDGSGGVMDYLTYYYAEDANCWRWINENTDPEDRVGSFEIRYYYINRDIFPLDCQEAAILYDPNLTIGGALSYLRSHGVEYILSPGWVSTSKTLPAYSNLAITAYLGNPRYLPAVYVYGSSAIYHVGPLDTGSLIAGYLEEDTIPPVLGLDIELIATLERGSATFALQVPGDYYQRGNLTVQTLSRSGNVTIEIWEGVYKDVENLFKAPAVPAARSQTDGASEIRINWALQGGSYILVVKSLDPHPNPPQVRLRISMSEVQSIQP